MGTMKPTLEQLIKAKIPCPETGIEVRRTLCDICCPGTHCGVDAYVKDGRIIKVEGTKDHPFNAGRLCPKGSANRQYIYREDRIRTPLRRVGERGEGKFEPISWDEALDLVANRMMDIKKEYGSDALAGFACSRSTNEDIYMLQKMVRTCFGSNNTDNCARV